MKKTLFCKKNRIILTLFLGVALCLGTFFVFGGNTVDAADTAVPTYINNTVTYAKGSNSLVFYDDLVEDATADSTDQLALAMGRYTVQTAVTADEFANYLGYVNHNLTVKKGVLPSAADYLGVALAVDAAGGKPTAAGTDSGDNSINLLYKGIYSRSLTTLSNEGTATVAYALLTLDALHVSDATMRSSGSKVTRMQLKDNLVAAANNYASSSAPDVSLCGLVLQALAPYYHDKDTAVVATVGSLLQNLHEFQAVNGSFKDSVVATGQLMTGLCALGIDPAKIDGYFDYSVYNGLLTFLNSDGGFGLSASSSSTVSATNYARIALVAYWCYQNNTSFYDFSGVTAHTAKTIPVSASSSSSSSSSSTSSSTKSSSSSPKVSSSSKSSNPSSPTASSGISSDTTVTAAESGTTIAKSVFEDLKGQDKTYSYEGTWNESEPYTISFYGKNITTPMDFNAEITSAAENQVVIDAAVSSPEYITFLQQGSFPGNATVTVTVSVPDGDYQCYYYNSETGGFELVGAVTVSDSMVSFEVNKGGDYFLTTEKINTGDIVMDIGDTVNGVVPQSVFEKIQGKDVNVRLNGTTDQGTTYAIVFNGMDIKQPMDFNMRIDESSDNSDDIAQLADDAWILHFEQEGDMPGAAMVEIKTNLDESLSYLLFYYDESLMQASYEQKVSISGGEMRFTIDHCSDYFVAQRAIADSLLNAGFPLNIGPMALTYIVVGLILLAAGIGVLLRRRGARGGKTGAGTKKKKPTARQQIAARKKAKANAKSAFSAETTAVPATAPLESTVEKIASEPETVVADNVMEQDTVMAETVSESDTEDNVGHDGKPDA